MWHLTFQVLTRSCQLIALYGSFCKQKSVSHRCLTIYYFRNFLKIGLALKMFRKTHRVKCLMVDTKNFVKILSRFWKQLMRFRIFWKNLRKKLKKLYKKFEGIWEVAWEFQWCIEETIVGSSASISKVSERSINLNKC